MNYLYLNDILLIYFNHDNKNYINIIKKNTHIKHTPLKHHNNNMEGHVVFRMQSKQHSLSLTQ